MGNEFRRVIKTPGGVTKKMKLQTNKRERREGGRDTEERCYE